MLSLKNTYAKILRSEAAKINSRMLSLSRDWAKYEIPQSIIAGRISGHYDPKI